MKKFNPILLSAIILGLLIFVPNLKVSAQNSSVSLEIEVSDILLNSQALNLTSLGLDAEGRGPVLISGFLQNLTAETLNNLYFDVTIRSDKKGDLVHIISRPNRSFSLDPYQTVYANNNNVASENIPGIDENISFDVTVLPAGDDLFDNLEGSTTLPADIYSVSVTVFQQTNVDGRVDLVTQSAEIGGDAAFAESIDFYLRTPGDTPDTQAEITNPYPQFSWEGDTGVEYRLIVVKNNGSDSPESLIQSAKSSAPITEGGSYLQYENLDIRVLGDSYQYPSSGAQPLEPGHTYFWQLSTEITEGLNVTERNSEIWSFKLATAEGSEPPIVLSDESKNLLIQLVGQSRYESLISSGFSLLDIEIEGVTFSGNQASIMLEQLLEKIEDGNVILSGDN